MYKNKDYSKNMIKIRKKKEQLPLKILKQSKNTNRNGGIKNKRQMKTRMANQKLSLTRIIWANLPADCIYVIKSILGNFL